VDFFDGYGIKVGSYLLIDIHKLTHMYELGSTWNEQDNGRIGWEGEKGKEGLIAKK
jgi:hypothetical protein